MKYLKNKINQWQEEGKEPTYEFLSIQDFIQELDYATHYLSRLLKTRPLIVYIMLFKKAYLEEGQRNITVKLSEIGKNLLSDQGTPMSHAPIKNGVNDLVKLNIIYKDPQLRPGQINRYEIRLPSEIPAVKEMINTDSNQIIEKVNLNLEDCYTDPLKRIEIFERDNKQCFYCLCELKNNTFYLDHIFPRSQGGENYKSNLITSCKTCNSKKSDKNAETFLLDNYRGGLITQEEFLNQKATLENLIETYENCKLSAG
ncbi:MAG: hypothetical protein DRQ78_06995 [Epsilonproteobacteria bacterium]|nr:MAG: hypothetical protein DRQ78_06995 [Campylobacterota bacterium]